MPQNAAIKQVLKMRENLHILANNQRQRHTDNQDRGGKGQLAAYHVTPAQAGVQANENTNLPDTLASDQRERQLSNNDRVVKGQFTAYHVTPAQAGVQANENTNLPDTLASDQRERQLSNNDRGVKWQFTANWLCFATRRVGNFVADAVKVARALLFIY